MSVVAAGLCDFDDFDAEFASVASSFLRWADRQASKEEVEDLLSEAWIAFSERDLSAYFEAVERLHGPINYREELSARLLLVVQCLFISRVGERRRRRKRRRTEDITELLTLLVVRERFEFEEACEILTTNHRVTQGELDEMAARIPFRFHGR